MPCEGLPPADAADVMARPPGNRVRKLGFERSRIAFDAWDSLRSELPLQTSLEPVAGAVEDSAAGEIGAELELIRQSVATNSQAFEQAPACCGPRRGRAILRRESNTACGASGRKSPAFDTIVAAGARTALPHASPTAARFRPRDAVLVDMGAMQEGYASDMTRMLFFGTPGAKMRKLYRAVLEAQLAAIDAVRAGVAAGAVDRARAAYFRPKASAARSPTPQGTAWPGNPRGAARGQARKAAAPGRDGDHHRTRRLHRRIRRRPHRGHRRSDRRRLRSAHADSKELRVI